MYRAMAVAASQARLVRQGLFMTSWNFLIMLDIPFNPDDEVSDAEVAYVKGQFLDAIKQLEELTGKKFDEKKFEEACKNANRTASAWLRVCDYLQYKPAPYSGRTISSMLLYTNPKAGAYTTAVTLTPCSFRGLNRLGSLGQQGMPSNMTRYFSGKGVVDLPIFTASARSFSSCSKASAAWTRPRAVTTSARMCNIPLIMIDIPYNNTVEVHDTNVAYVRAQFDHAIKQLEGLMTYSPVSRSTLREARLPAA